MVDCDSPEALISAFTNIDVVISTFDDDEALNRQGGVAKAAKAASVKLFVPSEFGSDIRNATEGLFLVKAQIHAKLREIGMPYSLFTTSVLSDWIFVP